MIILLSYSLQGISCFLFSVFQPFPSGPSVLSNGPPLPIKANSQLGVLEYYNRSKFSSKAWCLRVACVAGVIGEGERERGREGSGKKMRENSFV